MSDGGLRPPDGLDLGIDGYVDAVEIAHGGFGTVYRARQPKFSRTVAVKVLPFRPDERVRERFERECKAIGSLSGHPNIATVFDSGVTAAGHLFLAMEYAPNGTLADRVRRDGPMSWADAVAIGVKLAGAVETAHRGGVLHRDIKPENVLVSEYGEPRLTDFGLARLSGYESASHGNVAASVPHAPPEVLGGSGATHASDVYSLASTIVTLVFGRPPFAGGADDDLMAIIGRIATQPPPDLTARGVPAGVAAVLERAMAKDPTQRQASAAELGRALQDAQRDAAVATTPLPLLDGAEIASAEAAGASTDELAESLTDELGRGGSTRMFMREGRTPPAERTTEPVAREEPATPSRGALDAPSVLRGDFDRPAGAGSPPASTGGTAPPPPPPAPPGGEGPPLPPPPGDFGPPAGDDGGPSDEKAPGRFSKRLASIGMSVVLVAGTGTFAVARSCGSDGVRIGTIAAPSDSPSASPSQSVTTTPSTKSPSPKPSSPKPSPSPTRSSPRPSPRTTTSSPKPSPKPSPTPNRAPVANDDPNATQEHPLECGKSYYFEPLKNDTDPDGDTLRIISVGIPTDGGSATFTSTRVTYYPPEACGCSGGWKIPYTISDGRGGTDSAAIKFSHC